MNTLRSVDSVDAFGGEWNKSVTSVTQSQDHQWFGKRFVRINVNCFDMSTIQYSTYAVSMCARVCVYFVSRKCNVCLSFRTHGGALIFLHHINVLTNATHSLLLFVGTIKLNKSIQIFGNCVWSWILDLGRSSSKCFQHSTETQRWRKMGKKERTDDDDDGERAPVKCTIFMLYFSATNYASFRTTCRRKNIFFFRQCEIYGRTLRLVWRGWAAQDE